MNGILARCAPALLAAATWAVAQTPDADFQKLDDERLDQSGTVITIIFDDSGSMYGTKLAQAKDAFRAWLKGVPDEHRIGLIALNAGPLVAWKRGNKAEVAGAVERLQASGGTPLASTISDTVAQIRQRQAGLPFERNVLLVFTDGEDDSVPPAVVRERLAAAAASRIETVGIGFHGEGDYMRDASTRYFNAGDTGELLAGLQKVDVEIGDTSDIRIEPDVLAMMKTIGPEASSSPAAAADGEAAPSSPASVVEIAVSFLIVVLAAVVVISVLARIARPKRK